MKKLTVDLGERSYPIYIAANLLGENRNIAPYIHSKQVLIVTNETIAPLYLEKLIQTLGNGFQVDTVILPDGERYKNLDTTKKIFDTLLEKKHHRTTTLIALGGGVVGDMTGFVAATYQRGVAFVQIPTTLLSQVDSSVGGKTGVNHPLGKNMIGAFHQPNAVIIDTRTLATLPDREFSAGMAEVIKYGLIRDADFFIWLEQNLLRLMDRDEGLLAYAIEVSCRNKAEIVAADEREHGMRALLNFGHTFGHAIEAHQGYGNWLHGEAVACGMVIAAEVSVDLGWLNKADVQRIRDLLHAAKLPITAPGNMTPKDFFAKMQVDKKVMSGSIRYILLKGIGQAVIEDNASVELVERSIRRCMPD